MKQLNTKFLERLSAQAEEAENIGLNHIANHLTDQIVKRANASNASFYDPEEYDDDIESCVWDAVIATASFHGTSFDALQMQDLVEKFAYDLKSSCRRQMGVKTSVGVFENKVPGEK